MKLSFSLILFCFSFPAFSQIKESGNNALYQTIYFSKTSGDSIRIFACTEDPSADSATINVDLIKRGKPKNIQIIKLEFYYPLDLRFAFFDKKKGIIYKYDPAVKNGNSYLFLYNEKSDKLQEVKGFINLGMIDSININQRVYNYSYYSCGCADACWTSVLFEINNYRIDTLALIRCDCENLIMKSTRAREIKLGNCDGFNNLDKLNQIKKYWTEKPAKDQITLMKNNLKIKKTVSKCIGLGPADVVQRRLIAGSCRPLRVLFIGGSFYFFIHSF